jgi:zinc/manganese transport system substrate-binding protein
MRQRWLLFFLLAISSEPIRILAEPKLRIVTTALHVYCLTSAIAGQNAVVENLLSSSVEPHDYQLTPADLRRLQLADLIVANGLGFEPWLEKALTAGNQKGKIIFLSQDIGPDLLMVGGGGEINPHIWLDPLLAMRGVTNILGALQKMDSGHSQSYARNAADCLNRLRNMDQKIAASLQPVAQQPFITYHDAFPYFARRYHLRLPGVVERIPEIPPSAKELVQLFRIIRREKVRAIYTELIDPPRLARQIAKDASLTLAALDTIETGPANPTAYEKGMLENAATLARTLSQ